MGRRSSILTFSAWYTSITQGNDCTSGVAYVAGVEWAIIGYKVFQLVNRCASRYLGWTEGGTGLSEIL